MSGLCPINFHTFVIVATLIIMSAADDGSETRRRHQPDARPLRPALSISDRILPIQLVDTTGGHYVRVPKRNNLRPSTLLATLGADFNPTFMAQNKPTTLIEEPSSSAADSNDDSTSDAKLLADLNNLNLSTEIVDVPADVIRAFESWLLAKASCPVRYVWDDVGPLFWPRWIKRGECVNVVGRGCSWPEGQRCVPAESVTVHLLRWHCRTRKGAGLSAPGGIAGRMRVNGAGGGAALGGNNNNRKKPDRRSRKRNRMYRCQWLKVPYPVTAECFCSC